MRIKKNLQKAKRKAVSPGTGEKERGVVKWRIPLPVTNGTNLFLLPPLPPLLN